MEDMREQLTIGRFLNDAVVSILLLYGLIYFLFSCTIEISDKPDPRAGKRVPVNFALKIGSYGDDEMVESRRLNVSKEPATDYVRVANNIYMYATLSEEHPVTTRSTYSNLPEGSLVRIVAYNSVGTLTLIDSATYITTGGELWPVNQGLSVPENASYWFVAYSLSVPSLAIPPQSNDTNLTLSFVPDPNIDLLWGKTSDIYISDSDTEVADTIKVVHKLSRVRIEATTDMIIPAVKFNKIENAYLHPNYGSSVNLDAFTGNLTAGATPHYVGVQFNKWRDQGATVWGTGDNLNSTDVESDYILIFTNESNIVSLFIDNMIIDGKNFRGYEFRFSSKTLLPGHSYTLKLNFRRLVWAGSNIYWDGAKLTFLPENIPEAAQGYQGVYFLWGSLVGISPKGNFDNANTILYVHNGISTWSNTQRAASGHDWTGTTMADIPHIKTGEFLVNAPWFDDHRLRNYLVEVHNPGNRTGDICKFLTDTGDAPPGEWRMPNFRELGIEANEYDMYVNHQPFWDSSIIKDDGTTNFYTVPSYAKKTVSETIFPAGGSRVANGDVTTGGTFYFSGSPTVKTNQFTSNIFDAVFTLEILRPNSVDLMKQSLSQQGPVRCMRLIDRGISFNLGLPTVDVEDFDNGGTFGDGDTSGQGDVWY
jgi:hypothetical protein